MLAPLLRLRRLLPCLAGLAALAASAAAIQAYVANGPVWGIRNVPFYVNPANADVAEGSAEAAIREGGEAWGTQSNATFSFVYAGRTSGTTLGYNAKNEMFFRNSANGSVIAETLWTYDGSGKLVDADIAFYDGGFRFYTGTSGCSSGFYLEDIATHEFGHALGLGHSSVASATMYATTPYCGQDLRTLEPDDIAGVEALYPPTAVQRPAAPTSLTAAVNAGTPTSAIDLRWTDNSGNEDEFLVERTTDGASYMQVARVAANTTSYTNSGLASGTAYTYRVRASNTAGFSGYTNLASATTTSQVAGGGTGDGLRGEYFDNMDLTAPAGTRVDATVDFDWGASAPLAGMGADTFSVRWTGKVQAPVSETYTFHTVSDDGVRLWVNGQVLVDNWTNHAPTENSGSITLTAGQQYDVKLEFFENGGGAVARLLWSSPSTPKAVVPTGAIYSN